MAILILSTAICKSNMDIDIQLTYKSVEHTIFHDDELY